VNANNNIAAASVPTRAEGSIRVTHETGLHARPSVKFTKLAKSFKADIEIAAAAGGPWIDAKSIVKVMATKMPKDSFLHLRAAGPDAKAAVEALIDLVRRDFDDGVPPG
jgi:phosphocarrier protein